MTGDAHLPHPFAAGDRTFPVMLSRQAARHGGRPLFTCADETWSYAETLDVARAMAGRYASIGAAQGDRIALLSRNSPAMMRALLGAFWLGAVAVPIHAAAQGPQIEHCLATSGARLLIVAAELLPQLALCDLDRTAVELIWIIGDAHGPSLPRRCEAFDPHGPLAAAGDVRPGDTMAILFTSGTTGPAKGVMCPHAQFYWWGAHSSRFLDVGADDVLATTLPLFHTNALNTFFQALLCGARLVVLERFSASRFWDDMIGAGGTVGYLLGAMVPMLLAQPPDTAERAHVMRVALGPGVPEDVHIAFRQRTGVALADGFGSTETNFVIGTTAAERRPGSIGRLSPGFEAGVVDVNDEVVPPGVAGELVLRADAPFAFATGYFGMSEATVSTNRNLWFHTGDRVVAEADGNYRFVDRLKDSIRRRGENISSFEVEQVLLSHPAVAAVAVYAVPSSLAEDEVMAAILTHGNVEIDYAELTAFCAARLPRFAVPRYVERVEELPRTENGKVQKYRLQQRGVTATTWDRERSPDR